MASEWKHLSPEEFPPLLREIPDPPEELFLEGELPAYDLIYLAIVGSRAATPYGREVTAHLIDGLRGLPVAIISGLAYGIDACAHRAALDNEILTIAVPGSGLDSSVLYPRAHVGLAEEIVHKGGALLSEFEPKQAAAPWTFPQRNRIMAGMTKATLVVEAKEKSGSLITARLAAEYNRDLLVVPGSIFSSESRGVHQFLRLGATPITSQNDLREALGFLRAEELPRNDISSDEARVLEIIASPCSRDELMQALNLPVTKAAVLLSTMELKGLIREEMGTFRTR